MNDVIAWRYLCLNWSITAALFVALAVLVMATDFQFKLADSALYLDVGLSSLIGIPSFYLLRSGTARWPNMAHAGAALASLIIATVALLPLSYIAASADFPLQDGNLYALDRLVGLDWQSYIRLADAYRLGTVSNISYVTINTLFVLPILLCGSGFVIRSHELAFACISGGTITIALSILVPALGGYSYLGLNSAEYSHLNPFGAVEHARDINLVRDGAIRVLEMHRLGGIVMFPSWHASAAVIFAWALWPIRWARPLGVIVGSLMLLATPIDGGHYFVDLLAGVAVAGCVIWAARKVTRAIAPRLAGALSRATAAEIGARR